MRRSCLWGLPQLSTEQCFIEALAERDILIDRPTELVDFSQDEHSVTAQLVARDLTGFKQSIRSRYLIGADGFNSRVRQQLGIDYHQVDLEHQLQLLDVALDWPFREDVTIWLEDAGAILAFKLSDGVIRFAGNDLSLIESIPELPTQRQVIWQSNFDVHFAQVQEYGRGRIWLAGDAAHVHSPIGGRGMNMGIADGIALGTALTTGQLTEYAKQRYTIAANWVKANRVLTQLLVDTGTRGKLKRQAIRATLKTAALALGDKLPTVMFKRMTGS